MARKNSIRPTSFGEVFDLGLFKEIGFPLAFPIMPLEAFLWASAPGRFDQFSIYEIKDRKITRNDRNEVMHDFGTLTDKLDHHYFTFEDRGGVEGAIEGDFVGSKQAIDFFKSHQTQIVSLGEAKRRNIRLVESLISGKGDFCQFV